MIKVSIINSQVLEDLPSTTFPYSKSGAGFTLIELLITIAVIGILASAILVIINPLTQIQKTRDAQRKSDLAQIQRALEQYYQDNGSYPTHSTTNPDYRIYYNGQAADWGTPDFSPYMAKLPQDPVNGKYYVYYSDSTGNNQSYYLYASLDRGANDQQACSSNFCDSITNNVIDENECGGSVASPCNFGVTSPNTTIE